MASWVAATLVAAFAALLTAHVTIVAALLRRRPRLRGLVGLVPPLAPLAVYWALRERMYVRCAIWLVALFIYFAALLAAYALPVG